MIPKVFLRQNILCPLNFILIGINWFLFHVVILAICLHLNVTAFIKYFVIRVRRLHEGGVYSKSNLFLANNGVVTDLFNLKKHRHVIVPV